MISYFVAGILVGWVLEWLFFTFWVKEKQSASNVSAADLNSLKSELSAKNVEIASLKSKLYKTDDSASASADAKVASTAKVTTSATSKTSDASKAKSTAASSTASATKKADSKTTDKKPVATEATKKSEKTDGAKGKATPSKASASKKAESETATKKPVAKKAPAKAKRVVGKNKAGHDDFTLLSGIGPSAASKLNEIGIMTFPELAAMDDDDLRAKLEAAGARLNSNKVAMDSWNEQATLASKSDFDGLKKLQATLKL